jgi:hypothetical protein
MDAQPCARYVRAVIQSLGKQFATRVMGDRCIISTPYALPNEDRIEVSVRPAEGIVEVSDRGLSLGYLFLQGINLTEHSRQELMLQSQLRRFGVEAERGRIVARVSEEEVEDAIERVTEAAMAVSLLAYTGKSHGAYDFRSEVGQWLDSTDVPFSHDLPMVGFSGQLYAIPFVLLPTSARPSYLEPLHADTRAWAQSLANRTVARWADLGKKRPSSFRAVALVDDRDTDDVWDAPGKLVAAFADDFVLWSGRDEWIEGITDSLP